MRRKGKRRREEGKEEKREEEKERGDGEREREEERSVHRRNHGRLATKIIRCVVLSGTSDIVNSCKYCSHRTNANLVINSCNAAMVIP